MREIEITEKDAGQRLDKILGKYLRLAEKSFIHKMLRKKNITLNDQRAGGERRLRGGDRIRIWMSEETMEKFGAPALREDTKSRKESEKRKEELREKDSARVFFSLEEERIVYEDEEILVYNKPAGLLSQKAKAGDISLNDLLLDHLRKESEPLFTPSICNRLDRNTSGLVLCAKTYRAARGIGDLMKDRKIDKAYLCIVSGSFQKEMRAVSWLKKDEAGNRVTIRGREFPGAKYIETRYRSLYEANGMSLLLAELITGRSHQIRAQLSYLGHPIIGDKKYGRPAGSKKRALGDSAKHQLLHAFTLRFPLLSGELSYLSSRVFFAPPPQEFSAFLPIEEGIGALCKEGELWRHGNREA